MPVVKTKQNVAGATVPPKREPIPPGTYSAVIQKCDTGVTQTAPPLDKITCEFRILKNLDNGDEQIAGRRVYQDYILEPNPTNAEMNAREAFRLRQLLDATEAAYEVDEAGNTGFNTDHLAGKSVKIAVRQRQGTKKGEDGLLPIFNRVERVDALVVDESAII